MGIREIFPPAAINLLRPPPLASALRSVSFSVSAPSLSPSSPLWPITRHYFLDALALSAGYDTPLVALPAVDQRPGFPEGATARVGSLPRTGPPEIRGSAAL